MNKENVMPEAMRGGGVKGYAIIDYGGAIPITVKINFANLTFDNNGMSYAIRPSKVYEFSGLFSNKKVLFYVKDNPEPIKFSDKTYDGIPATIFNSLVSSKIFKAIEEVAKMQELKIIMFISGGGLFIGIVNLILLIILLVNKGRMASIVP